MSSIVFNPSGQPASPSEGEVYYDSTADKLKLRDASGFREIVSKNSSGEIDGTFSGSLPSFVGMIASFAMATPPTGWLACDGSAVSKATYSALFTALGANAWGTDTTDNFYLPDLEGAFLRGTGAHGTHQMASESGSAHFTGPNVGSFEDDQFQGHGHTLYSKGGYGNNDSIVAMRDAPGGSGAYAIEDRNGFVQQPVEFDYSSPRYGDETRPFNAGVKYCIKF